MKKTGRDLPESLKPEIRRMTSPPITKSRGWSSLIPGRGHRDCSSQSRRLRGTPSCTRDHGLPAPAACTAGDGLPAGITQVNGSFGACSNSEVQIWLTSSGAVLV